MNETRLAVEVERNLVIEKTFATYHSHYFFTMDRFKPTVPSDPN